VQTAVAKNPFPIPRRVWLIGLIVLLACFRFAHVHLLWTDEDYHIAAAIQILHGKIPYRDFWYDKPPLSALYYLAIGGYSGWLLRLLDAAYVLAACWLCYKIARRWWSEAEAFAAALLFAFFMAFYLPTAVIPFAVDALMMVPHLAAIYLSARRQPFWAGIFAGIAFLVNAKGLLVLLICALWLWRDCLLLAIGFAIPTVVSAGTLYFLGAWPGYLEQVWRWGLTYTEGSPLAHPIELGIIRTTDWLGFHSALALSAGFGFLGFSRGEKWKIGSWLALSFVAVWLGTRFAPRYFLQVLPGMVIAASRGIVVAVHGRHRKVASSILAICLLVPFIRFGPRYFSLAFDDLRGQSPNWIDVNLDLDSQDVAQLLKGMSRPGDMLFIWGYRPDIYVYTRLVAPGVFWDSQPLTGVPADRHLHVTDAIYGGPAAANRQKVIQTHPTWIVDGLGPLNPRLRPEVYPEIKQWMSGYRLVGRTKVSLIYRRE